MPINAAVTKIHSSFHTIQRNCLQELLYYKTYESKAWHAHIKKNAETSALKIKNYCNCAATVLFLSNAWATSSVATVLIESPGMNARFAIRL